MVIGIRRTTMYMSSAATAAVHIKVMTVVPRTFPALFTLPILAMAEEMEQNTIGTTTQNIRFMKTVPSGSSAVAPGQTAPVTQPATMPISMVMRNQYLLKNFPVAFMVISPFQY